MKILLRMFLIAVFALQLACTSTKNQAPVVDGWKQSSQAGGDYRVQSDDSLYSIAWAFGVDYHDLARYNQLSEPYALHAGQVLHMYPPVAAPSIPTAQSKAEPVTAVPVATPVIPPNSPARPQQAVLTSAQPKPKMISKTLPPAAIAAKPVSTPVTTRGTAAEKWLWPTKGHIVRGYSAGSGGNHGLDITGKLNQPVLASASGKVVYAGSGMPGYGNLIIIKHNENDLSAYAFNKTLEVKEGDSVKAGQCIAYMGKNDAGQTLLHFEIRRDGKPVDPKSYLR